MLRIGLTGGIGSGKSTVSQMLATLGVPVIDCDEIARTLLNSGPTFTAVIDHFGSSFLTDKQHLNRNLLKTRIFQNPNDKAWLEQLLHPLIKAEIEIQLCRYHSPYCLIEIPLLVEAQLQSWVDKIWVISSEPHRQITRIKKRDHLNKKIIDQILSSQASNEQRLKFADEILENNGDLPELHQAVIRLHGRYSHLK